MLAFRKVGPHRDLSAVLIFAHRELFKRGFHACVLKRPGANEVRVELAVLLQVFQVFGNRLFLRLLCAGLRIRFRFDEVEVAELRADER